MRSYKTAADYAYSVLRERIMSGALGPGEYVDTKQIADELGISITPVREALRIMAAENWVDIHPHRHVRIKPLSGTDLRELYEARSLVEGLACEQIFKNISGLSLDELAVKIDRSADALREGRFELVRTLNDEFHEVLYSYVGNKYLLETLHTLKERSQRYIEYSRRYQKLISNFEEHRKILESLRSRDLPGFIAAVQHDLAHTLEFCMVSHSLGK